jgi:hypothetical protein
LIHFRAAVRELDLQGRSLPPDFVNFALPSAIVAGRPATSDSTRDVRSFVSPGPNCQIRRSTAPPVSFNFAITPSIGPTASSRRILPRRRPRCVSVLSRVCHSKWAITRNGLFREVDRLETPANADWR